MSMWSFTAFLAYSVVVFLLASCIYGRHIRRMQYFLWALAIFLAGLMIHDIWELTVPRMQTFAALAAPAPATTPSIGASQLIVVLGRWFLYASLPLFVLACTGGPSAFPQCSACGYNLTGNDSGVCPECGKKL